MDPTFDSQRLDYLRSTLWQFRLWWLLPAAVGLTLAIVYALFLRTETWSARQSFIVRDDLTGQSFKPGRFESQESMKSAQETILEISRRPQVIRNTLEKLGPGPGDPAGPNWITDELIEDVQGSISFSAPNGAEFGKTEVIVLTTQATTRERSRQFIETLSDEIVDKVNQVRSLRLQGMQAELIQARDGAMRQQQIAEQALQEMDARLGSEIGVLTESQSGESPVELEIREIKALKRSLETEVQTAESTHKALLKVYENPDQLLYLSGDLLNQSPGLATMKTELVRLQSQLATVSGGKRDSHAEVQAARRAVDQMEAQIFQSLKGEMAGLQNSIARRRQRMEQLDDEIATLKGQLVELGKSRAKHLRLTVQVQELTEAANEAQTALTKIQSLAEAARTVGLMTLVDEPQVSSRPDGLGKKAIAAAGGLGGLIFGLGLVMLIAPPMPTRPVSDASRAPASGRVSPTSNAARSVTATASASPTYAEATPPAAETRGDQSPRVAQPSVSPSQPTAAAIRDAAAAMQQAAKAMQVAAQLDDTPELRQTLEEKALPQANRSTGADFSGTPEHREPATEPAGQTAQPATSKHPRTITEWIKSNEAASSGIGAGHRPDQPEPSTSDSPGLAPNRLDEHEQQASSGFGASHRPDQPKPSTSDSPGLVAKRLDEKPKARPIDLLRSAENAESFVQASPDRPTTPPATPASTDQPVPTTNVFLNRPQSNPPAKPVSPAAPPKPVAEAVPVQPAQHSPVKASGTSADGSSNPPTATAQRMPSQPIGTPSASSDGRPSPRPLTFSDLALAFESEEILSPISHQEKSPPAEPQSARRPSIPTEARESAPTMQLGDDEFNSDLPRHADPEQIKKLSESIAKFIDRK